MKAVCWAGKRQVSVEKVPDPGVLDPRDVVVKVSLTAICGSDLHLYSGAVPGMRKGDILGHEFMGEVVDAGPEVTTVRSGDRVVVPFAISCGGCFFCRKALFSLCDNTNPAALDAEKAYGFSPAGMFGYSHLFGGYAGGQAEFVRVPFADVGVLKVPPGVPDEKLLPLADILPTAFQAAEQAGIEPGDAVAVWGCGPVGQLAVACARMLGAARVFAIDFRENRLAMARSQGAETFNFQADDGIVFDWLRARTGGRGPDRCIDCVGLEAHGSAADALADRVKTALYLGADRIHALRQAIHCCRKGGTVSIPGVYGGVADKFPLGQAFNKGLTLRMGQTHVQKYMRMLLERILDGQLDPSFVITDRAELGDAPSMYERFSDHADECVKVVMTPGS